MADTVTVLTSSLFSCYCVHCVSKWLMWGIKLWKCQQSNNVVASMLFTIEMSEVQDNEILYYECKSIMFRP